MIRPIAPRFANQRRLVALASATLLLAPAGLVTTIHTAAAAGPATVTVAGDLQSELGCPADWDPTCDATTLAPVAGSTVWSAVFDVPAGSWQFKIAIDRAWDENYGGGGAANGANIPLVLAKAMPLRLTYDSASHGVTIAPTAAPAPTRASDRALARHSVRAPLTRERFYFVMPDRFADGNSANNTGGIAGGPRDNGYDPTNKGFYHGGDLAGLLTKLDYIKGMGTTAIWMTPMFKNKPVQGVDPFVSAGYHGYWITDFTTIDPHFGTNAELQAVVRAAHARGMKVFFDIITNHTADVIRYQPKDGRTPYGYVSKTDVPYRDAGGQVFDDKAFAAGNGFPRLQPAVSFPYVPYVPAAEQGVKVPAWLNAVNRYHNRGDSTFAGESAEYGDFVGLDDLFTEQPAVRDGMIDIYKTWAEFGIDGYRIDTVKHVNMEFWQKFSPAVTQHAAENGKPNFFMFGEVFDANPAFMSQYTTTGKLPATLDFGFQQKATDFAVRDKPTIELRDLFALDDYYTDADSNVYELPTFLGNHDMGRIGNFLSTAQPAATAAQLLQRNQLAHALMYLTRGQPVVYYGDEQGFTGDGGDQDARQDMFPTKVATYADDKLIDGNATLLGTAAHYDRSAPMYRTLAKLSALVTRYPALRDGAQIDRYASNEPGVYAFSRIDRREQVEHLVAVNNSTASKTVTLQTFSPKRGLSRIFPTGLQPLRTDGEGRVTVTVPPFSARVWRAVAPLRPTEGVASPDLMTPSTGQAIGGRAEIRAFVPGNGFVETTFAARPVGTKQWSMLGTDDNAPYRVFADTTQWAKGTVLELRAVVREADGGVAATGGYAYVGDPVPVTGSGVVGPPVQPGSVTVAGDLDSEIGCTADWMPNCAAAHLTLDPADGVWKASFDLPAGAYAYKVAINDAWDENYGAGAAFNGGNIPVTVPAGGASVQFWYDPRTHWVADSLTSEIVTAPGSFQSEMGCAADWDPACMRSWLQDPDHDGIFTLATTEIPAGSYEVKVAHDLSLTENYGAGGQAGGANIPFTVSAGQAVSFSYVVASHTLTISTFVPEAKPDLSQQRAFWIDPATIAWQLPPQPQWHNYRLHWSAANDLGVDAEAVTGGHSIALTYDPAGLRPDQLKRFPALAGYSVLRVHGVTRDELTRMLAAQLAVAAYSDTGKLVSATGVDTTGVRARLGG